MSDGLEKVLKRFWDFVVKDEEFNFICGKTYNCLNEVALQLNTQEVARNFFVGFGKPPILFPYNEQSNGNKAGIGYKLYENSVGIYFSGIEKEMLGPQDFRRNFETGTKDIFTSRQDRIKFLNQITPEEIIIRFEQYPIEEN